MARKQLRLTGTEKQEMSEFAAANGVSTSALGAAWIRSYIEYGTEYEDPGEARVEITLPLDELDAAEERAESEGITLQDVIKHEIAALRDL